MSILALRLIAENKITKAPFLDLGDCGLVNYLPEELLDCVWLTGLNLGHFYIDIESKIQVSSDNKRTKNIFSGKELYGLEKLVNLQELCLNWCRISDFQFLKMLTGLRALDLSSNKISDIHFVEKLTGLQTLNLSFNQLSDIQYLGKLTDLQTLDLSSNEISDIHFLENLTGLQILDLSSNGISDVYFLEKLTSLQTLDLNDNQLSDIHFLEKLIGLQTLDLSDNQLSDIQLLGKLTNLQTLYLRYNSISDIQFLENLIGLQILDLGSNRISDIHCLENLTGLQELYLHKNLISDTQFLGKLTGLQVLYLSDNLISDIQFLEELIGLQELYLSDNQISDIQFLKKLVGLQALGLSNNQISAIQSLEQLTSLQELYLDNNEISDIQYLETQAGLQILELSDNQISAIQSLEQLTSLRELYLKNNQLFDINGIKKISSSNTINFINFSGNPLPLPEGLDLSDITALRSYFKDGEAGVTNKRSVKLLFMGDGCAGKSTLYQHLKTNVPPQEIAVNDRTHGISLDVWSGVLPDVEVRVWDFGGQDVFHSTHRLFLGQGAIYVVVWTKQANKKCTQGEQHPLRYWLDFIAEYGKNSRVLLVENTIDGQFDSTEFPDDTTLEQLVEEYNEKGIYLDTSLHRIDCKYDTRKVKKLKAILQNEIEQLVEDYPIKDFPANWYAVQQNLEQLKLVRKTIVWEDYQAICDQENISDAKALVKYLDQSGVVSYYPDLFEQQVILQTDWILEAMYAFLQLENNPIAREGGKLREKDFRIVWGTNYTEDEQALFKSYMLKSEVMARPRDNYNAKIQRYYQYLIPALFNPCKAHEKVNWANEPHYIAIQFKFIYLAIIQRLQVKILTHCHVEEEESFYNNRISFTDKVGRTAHIELLVEEKELRIHAEHEDLYRDILTELNTIYPLDRLKVIERIKGQEDKEMDSRKVQHGKEYGFEKKGFLNEKEEDKKEPQQSMTMKETDKTSEIFFSYSWDKEGETESREQIVRELYRSLKEDNFNVILDKQDLAYRESISEFMKRIGRGKIVVVAISDAYLKSIYCMYEFYEIYKNALHDRTLMRERIFPIRVEAIALSKPSVLDGYFDYWENLEKEWEDLITKRGTRIGESQQRKYRQVKAIASELGDFLDFLSDMNSKSKEILSQDNFAEIKNAIITRLEE